MSTSRPTARWIGCGLSLAALLAPLHPARAAEPVEPATTEPATTEPAKTKPPIDPRRNSVTLGTQAKIPDWSSSLTVQRAFGRRVTLGVGVEYGYQAPGYWHLQGVGETLSGQLWLSRTFHGVFVEGSMTLAHQFLVRLPSLSITAVAPGLALGYRWTHRSGLTVGGSAGLRWGRVVQDSGLVCSRPKYCTSVREGPQTRISLDIGYVF